MITGSIVALVTPMHPDGAIDWSALEDVAAVPEGACPARDPKIRSREHRRAMRARAERAMSLL